MARDDNSRSQVESIMAAQMARSARLQHASKIITNDKDLTHLHDQIDTLHKDLLQP
jgi:dephospho-CoA kinase